MNGEIFFDMIKQPHPVLGSTKFLLKRWKKYTIYAKSGSYVRTSYTKSGSYGWDGTSNTAGSFRTNTPTRGTYYNESNPLSEDLYQTNSVYLYDYVVVTDKWFYEMVYTASIVDSTPSLDGDYVPINTWNHYQNTFKNSPNATTNNFLYTYNTNASFLAGHPCYGPDSIDRDDGTYFEILRGYPRNHFTHKRELFSLFKETTYRKVNGEITYGSYVRNSQTITTTIGSNGLEDGSAPIQSTQVGNVNLVKTDNVINH